MEKKELLEVNFGSGKLKAKISKNTAVKLMYGADVRLRDFAYETCIKHVMKHGWGLISFDDFPSQQLLYTILGQMLEKEENSRISEYLRQTAPLWDKPENETKMLNVLLTKQPDNDDAVAIVCSLLRKAQQPDIDKVTLGLISYYNRVASQKNKAGLLEVLKELLQQFPLQNTETLTYLSTFTPEKAEF